jgi:hypothetical protein
MDQPAGISGIPVASPASLTKHGSQGDRRGDGPGFTRIREIEAAGFVPIDAKPSLELKENFFAAFQSRQSDTQHSPGSRKRVDHEGRGR